MIYISIDTETGGLDPENHSLLQFGAIIEDTEKKLSFEDIPKFEVLIENDVIIGTPFALSMHKKILDELALPANKRTQKVISKSELADEFALWLCMNGLAPNTNKPIVINVAGKNFGTFDLRALRKVPHWEELIQVSHRLLDPAMLFWDPIKDKRAPNMETCKERAGIVDTAVAHTALADAWDVILLLRTKY